MYLYKKDSALWSFYNNLSKDKNKCIYKLLEINQREEGIVVPVLNLCTISSKCMDEWRYNSMHVFLISALYAGKRSASWPSQCIPREIKPAIHWTGSWMGPDLVWLLWKEKNLWLCLELNPYSPGIQPVPIHTFTEPTKPKSATQLDKI